MDNNTSPIDSGMPGVPGHSLHAYRHEPALLLILGVFAALFWLVIVGSAVAVAYFGHPALLLFFAVPALLILVIHLIAMSVFITRIKGNAVRITAEQFPDLYTRLLASCRRVGLAKIPEAYVMSGDGMLNAFAARFLRRYYVVLLSDVLNGVEHDPEAINFYIGHELGHVHRRHIAFGWLLHPVMFLPVIAAAYRRAQEYTCDQYGLACCASPASAAQAMVVLAAGPHQSKQVNIDAYVKQCEDTKGFWMSANELSSDYPWLCKRMRHISPQSTQKIPARNPLAWVLSVFLFRFGTGGFAVNLLWSLLIWFYLGVVGFTVYQEVKLRQTNIKLFSYGRDAAAQVGKYYVEKEQLPESLEAIGINPKTSGLPIDTIELDQDGGQITVKLKNEHTISYEPHVDDNGKVVWDCSTDVPKKEIPANANCTFTGFDPGDLTDVLKLMR